MRLLAPLWSSPRVKPPFGAVGLNRAHPLANGLVFFCLFRAAEPTGGIDLVTGLPGTATNAPNRSTRGLQLASSGYTMWANTSVPDAKVIATTGLTLVWRGVVASTGDFRHFMGKHLSNGATDNPFDFRAEGSGTQVHVLRANAAGVNDFAHPAGGIVAGEVAEYVFTFADNQVETIPLGYKNGASVAVGAGISVSGSVTGGGGPLNIGRRADGFVQLVGEVIHAAIWNRPLSGGEVANFYNAPYTLLQPLTRPLPIDDPRLGDPIALTRMTTR